MTGEVILGEHVRPLVATSYRKPQQHRSKETVERILNAADAEIGEAGLYGASTTSIAKRAGLSVGAVYRFFKDKDEIAEALTAEYLDDVWGSYVELVEAESPERSVAIPIRTWIAQAAHELTRHRGFFRLAEEVGDAPTLATAARVRSELTQVFADSLRIHGVVAADEELLPVVQLCADTVRHALVRADQPEERERVVAELDVMIPTYISTRFAVA